MICFKDTSKIKYKVFLHKHPNHYWFNCEVSLYVKKGESIYDGAVERFRCASGDEIELKWKKPGNGIIFKNPSISRDSKAVYSKIRKYIDMYWRY
jgi:hypothetical protein